MRTFGVLVLIGVLGMPLVAHASEKADLYPGTENWHRYGFVAVTLPGGISVPQKITVLWDNPQAGVFIIVVEPSDSDNPIVASSIGNDRMVSLDLGLFAGSYEIVLVGVSAPTHYHMTVTYGRDELLVRRVPPQGSWTVV